MIKIIDKISSVCFWHRVCKNRERKVSLVVNNRVIVQRTGIAKAVPVVDFIKISLTDVITELPLCLLNKNCYLCGLG